MRRWSDAEVVAFLARTKKPAEGEPKYLWPKGFRKSLELFGAVQLKEGHGALPLRRVFLLESPFAVMKFAQLGFRAVSAFGHAVSHEQARILSELAMGVIYVPDRNVYDGAVHAMGL